jgi:hypothetical protein
MTEREIIGIDGSCCCDCHEQHARDRASSSGEIVLTVFAIAMMSTAIGALVWLAIEAVPFLDGRGL